MHQTNVTFCLTAAPCAAWASTLLSWLEPQWIIVHECFCHKCWFFNTWVTFAQFFLIHSSAFLVTLRGHQLWWHETPPFLLQKPCKSKHYLPNTTNFQRGCRLKITYGVKITETKTLSFAIFTTISYDNITRNEMLTYDERI